MERGVSIFIDPSGAQTGGRVVKRELKEIGAAAVTAQSQMKDLSDAQAVAAKSAQSSAQIMTQQLDALRAKYNPTFAVLQRYKQTQEEIRGAHRLGALSVSEMTSALSRERQAALSSIEAIKGYGTALNSAAAARRKLGSGGGASTFNTANLAAQFQDIAVTSAMGMSPLQIALQQGTQLSAVLGPMGAAGAVKSLGAAFLSVINPVSLLTLGVVGVGAAALQYFGSMASSAKTSDDAIKQHADTIESIKDAYGVASEGLGEYVKKSQAEAAAAARTNLDVQKSVLKDVFTDFNNTIGTLQARTGGASDVETRFAPFAEAIRNLRQSAVDGIPDFVRFRSEVLAVAAVDLSRLGVLSDELINSSTAAADAGRRVKSANDVISGLGGIAAGQVSGVSSLTKAMNDLAGIAVPALNDAERALTAYQKAMDGAQGSEDRRSAAATYDAARKRISDQNPTVMNPQGRPVGVPVPGDRPNPLGEDRNSLTALANLANTSFGSATQSAKSLGQAVTGISSGLQTANIGVVNVTQSLANAQTQAFSAMQQSGVQVRTLKTELADIQKTLAEAAKTPVSEIFGDGVSQEKGSAAIATAAVNIEKVMTALGKSGMTASMAHEAIEMVRAGLIQLGGDAKSVNVLVDGMVAGTMRTMELKGAVEQLSQSILGIPNKIVNIGIRQYTVGATGGGTKGINVYGGGADFSSTQYDVGGGKTVGVHGGNGAAVTTTGYLVEQSDINGMYADLGYAGARAAGGPVSAGGTYLVGEQGPELVKMAGAGNVSTAGATASILSGGRDTLSLMEDHLYSIMQELKSQTDYMATAANDNQTMIGCLEVIKSKASASVSQAYGGSGSGSSSGSGSFSRGGSSSGGQSHLDPMSPYYFNAARGNLYGSGAKYDPVADAMLNGNVDALRGVSGGFTGAISDAMGRINKTTNSPSLLDRLKNQLGFATGGQIMPGEDQRVEFFKKNTERVIIVDDAKVSDGRGGKQAPRAERPVSLVVNFNGGVATDKRSQQAQADEIRRVVHQALRS